MQGCHKKKKNAVSSECNKRRDMPVYNVYFPVLILKLTVVLQKILF